MKDKPSAPIRRPRPISRPRLHDGPLKQLKDLLYQLYLDAGAPSMDDIATWISADDNLPGAPERDSIRRCIGSAEPPPNQHDVVSIAAVLARAARWNIDDAQVRIRSLWVKAHLVVPLGTPVQELSNPIVLKVHPVIDVPGAPEGLPSYLPRAHDEVLSTVLASASDCAVMVTIVGESSTGKTRAAYEAVRRILPDWNLYYPISPSKPSPRRCGA
jgi:hypothetical protein